jgi:integrase
LGITWEALDKDGTGVYQSVRIFQQVQVAYTHGQGVQTLTKGLKTKGSVRTLSLPQFVREAIERQAEWAMSQGYPTEGFLFITSTGTVWQRRNVMRSFEEILAKCELPQMRLHDLRHLCAALLLAQGVPLIVAKEILGHANIATTANVYAHVTGTVKQEALRGLDALLQPPSAPLV